MDHTKTHLTVAETADELDVSPATVRRMIANGYLDGHRTPGGHARITLASIDLYLSTRKTL